MELQKISASENKQVEEIILTGLENKAFSESLSDLLRLLETYIDPKSEDLGSSYDLNIRLGSKAHQFHRVQMLRNVPPPSQWSEERKQRHRVELLLFGMPEKWVTKIQEIKEAYNSTQIYPQTVGGSSSHWDVVVDIGVFTDTCNQNYNSFQEYSQIVGGSPSPPHTVAGSGGFTDTDNRNYNSSQAYSQTVGGSSSPPDVVLDIGGFPDTGNQNSIVQTHRLHDDQLYKLVENVFGVSAAAVFASSSTFPKAANAAGSMACLTAMSLRHRGWTATRFLAKFGAIACAVELWLPQESIFPKSIGGLPAWPFSCLPPQ